MDIAKYDIEIKKHAFVRAMQRGISPDMIEATIKGGQTERFAKHNIRFTKNYKNFKVICIGCITELKIKILTIEKGR